MSILFPLRSALLSLALLPISYAAPLQQLCDGEKKTCCLPVEFSGVAAFWVSAETCPKGMADDPSCAPQYGCKPIPETKNN
jgi:hypothetical protein